MYTQHNYSYVLCQLFRILDVLPYTEYNQNVEIERLMCGIERWKWDIKRTKSRSDVRCPTSRARSRDRTFDVRHRAHEVEIGRSMSAIKRTKSRLNVRCRPSSARSRD